MPPRPMIDRTTVTLMTTITALTRADSWMPITSNAVAAMEISIAGRLNSAVADEPSASTTAVPGAALTSGGKAMPISARNDTTYPTSRRRPSRRQARTPSTRSQPMIHATSSPSVAYP